jgi:hypothetical protein
VIAALMARWCATPCSLLFILLGWCGLFGSTLWAEEVHELLHLVEPLRQVRGGNSAITERLDNLQLLDEEVIKRVNFRSVDLALEHTRSPLLGGFQMVLPVGDGGFQCKLAKMPDVSGFGVRLVSQGISSSLSPPVEQQGDGTNSSTPKDASPRSNNRNVLYVFLFLWGHKWWVLTLWWGLMAFVVIVHMDWMYGMIYEWKISSTNV